MQNNLIKSANYYLKKGINVIATGSTKRAIFPWTKYQKELITKDDVQIQLSNHNAKGLAIICGAISGGLEVIDLDLKYDLTGTLYERLIEECPMLLDLYTVKTKSGGYHFYYYCEQVEGNKKLANRPPTEEELKANPHEKSIVLIETRGEGGYVIAPPTEGYEVSNRKEITLLTIEQRETILTACRSFNEVYQITEKPVVIENNKTRYSKTCWDDYNERSNPIELLERHGWTIVGTKGERTIFKRPGNTDSKSSGDYHHGLKLFKVFTTSSEFEPGKGYTPYAVYTLLEYKGNYSEAAKQLIKDGYGEKAKDYPKNIVNIVKSSINIGYDKEQIVAELMFSQKIKKDIAEKIIEDVTKDTGESVLTFWEVKETKNGKSINILRTKLLDFLKSEGFGLYYYKEGDERYHLIRQKDGFVTNENVESLKKFVINYIESLPLTFDGIMQSDLIEVVLKGCDVYFSKSLIDFLVRLTPNFLKDDAYNAYYPFKNGIVRVTKDGSKLLTYAEVNKVIWKSQVLNFNIDVDMEFDFELCEFYKFMQKISGDNENKLLYLISIIGFCLHRYKDTKKPYCVIFGEEVEDEKFGGGAGKGLLVSAIGKMLNVCTVDGKNFKVDKTFAFQRVGVDDNIIVLEDTRKNLNFESLFNIITTGITIEKKNKDEVYLDYSNSPKVLITTNFTIGTETGAHLRRQKLFEFSNFFNSKHTPYNYFGHKLFDDWDNDEYNRYYNLFFTCVSFYLDKDIIEYETSEKNNRKHIKLKFGEEFLFWFDEQKTLFFNNLTPLKDLYAGFLTQNELEKRDYSQKRFTKAIEESCEKFGYEFVKEKDRQSQLILVKIKKDGDAGF